ncbi:MAG TPA: beta-ketoacyl-[acyl-carrier-protein] synthase family protein [Chitinophagaceae bacterium]|nr:beta-ketoacyl-[acyl-carrier-protein] synthase family protein [Chitinophagaceae bacterium]
MNDCEKIWVCSMGAISSIGNNVNETFSSLMQLKSGVGNATWLATSHSDLPVCEIKISNNELADMANMKQELPRAAYFSAIAAQEAITSFQSQISEADFSKLSIGFISGNTIGGMDLSEQFFEQYLQNPNNGKLRQILHHECGSITDLVANLLNIKRNVCTISTACSSSANAIIHACRMLKHRKADMIIAGGTDALCRFTLNGFNTLMILDQEACKPFDENRKGLNLGEGAAYLVLVTDEIKNHFQLNPIAFVSGYANANDAFHQTASSSEGKGNFLAMQGALQMSQLNPSDIQYINAHGTGTANNDSSEGIAIEKLFKNQVPLVSSTKAYTGHTLGACGSLESVFSCLSIQNGVVFPTLRLQDDMKEFEFKINRTLRTGMKINHVMSNSFGFGGNCTSLIFSNTKSD